MGNLVLEGDEVFRPWSKGPTSANYGRCGIRAAIVGHGRHSNCLKWEHERSREGADRNGSIRGTDRHTPVRCRQVQSAAGQASRRFRVAQQERKQHVLFSTRHLRAGQHPADGVVLDHQGASEVEEQTHGSRPKEGRERGGTFGKRTWGLDQPSGEPRPPRRGRLGLHHELQ